MGILENYRPDHFSAAKRAERSKMRIFFVKIVCGENVQFSLKLTNFFLNLKRFFMSIYVHINKKQNNFCYR